MKNIRVLVANRPRLMRELVLATISDQPDIEIVGEVEDETEIEAAVAQKIPDFLIVALEEKSNLPDPCKAILQTHPNLRIIAIAPDQSSSMFYSTSFSILASQIETSEEGVLNALRGKAQFVGG